VKVNHDFCGVIIVTINVESRLKLISFS